VSDAERQAIRERAFAATEPVDLISKHGDGTETVFCGEADGEYRGWQERSYADSKGWTYKGLPDQERAALAADVLALDAALDALVAEIRSLNEQVVGAVDLLESAVAERDKLREALTDFAEHGTRFDCNPTVIVHNTPEWVASQEWWQNRAVQMDTAVRNRARAALAPTKEGT